MNYLTRAICTAIRLKLFRRGVSLALIRVPAAMFLSLLLASSSVSGRQLTAASLAQDFMQRSLTALTAVANLTDVTEIGTARRIAGSDDDNGPATLKTVSNGSARAD